MTSPAALRARLWKAFAMSLATALLVVGGATAPASASDPRYVSGHVYLGSAALSAGEGEVTVRWRAGNSLTYDHEVSTDADGNYVFPSLTSSVQIEFAYVGTGSYSSVNYPKSPIGSIGSWVTIGLGDVVLSDVVLAAKASIRGTVTLGATGTPAGPAEVLVSYQQRNNSGGYTPLSTPVPIDASGEYDLTALSTGMYRLFFDYVGSGDYYDVYYKSTPEGSYWQTAMWDVTFAAGADRTGVDIKMPSPSTVFGRVFLGTTATPAPADSVQVALRYYAPNSSTPTLGPVAVTDASGDFAITGAHSGDYDLVYTYVGGGAAHVPFTSTKRSVASNASATVANVTLAPTYVVSGSVGLGQSDNPAGDGDVTVSLKRVFQPVTFTATTDVNGHYSIAGVPAGDYDVSFAYVGDGQYRDFDLPGTHASGNKLHTQVLENSVLDAVLELGNGLGGSVVDSANSPLEGVAVYAVQFDRDSGDYLDEFETSTDADGNYSFRAIPDGLYRIDFELEGYASQSWSGISYFYDSDLLELTNGSITGGVDALLYHGGTIRGFSGGDAVNANPWSTVQLELQVLDSESGEWRFAAVTNASTAWVDKGRWEFTGLPPDTYRVSVNFGTEVLHTRTQSPTLTLSEGQTQLYFQGAYPGEYLEFGTLVKAPWVDTVYLANEDNLVRIGSMAAAADLGLSTSVVTASNVTIDAYYPLVNPLSSVVSCYGHDFVASKGVLTEVDPELVRSIPSTELGPNCVGHLEFADDFVSGALFLGPDASGRVYSIHDGERHYAPVAADRTVLAGSSAVKIFPVNNAYVARIPLGAPDISSGRLVKSSTASATYVINGTQLIPVSSSIATAAGIPGQVYALTPGELAMYSIASAPMSNVVDCAGASYLATQGKLWPVSSTSVRGLPATELSVDTCGRLPTTARSISAPLIVQSATTARIYVIAGGVKREVPSVASVRAPSTGGVAPKALLISEAWLASVPIGAQGGRPPPSATGVPASPITTPVVEADGWSWPRHAQQEWVRLIWQRV